MLGKSPSQSQQNSLFSMIDQLNNDHPLIALAGVIRWEELEEELAVFYSNVGRQSKPICLMSGLLMLKQMYNLSDEMVVDQWMMNPYY